MLFIVTAIVVCCLSFHYNTVCTKLYDSKPGVCVKTAYART